MNRRHASLFAALLFACCAPPDRRAQVIVDAGVSEVGAPDAGDDATPDPIADAADPDAADPDAADPDAADPDAQPPFTDITVARYDYRFDLDSGEARSMLTFDGFGSREACARLSSQISLRESTTEGLLGARIEQHDAGVSVCGTGRPGAFASLTADFIVPEAAEATGVGFSRKLDAHGNRFTYLLGWVEECDRFGPCDAASNRQSRFVFDVSHPTTETVLCPGTRKVASGRTTCELLGVPAPTYSAFAIAANSAWQAAPLVNAAGVSVVVYEVSEGRVRAALDASAVGAFLAWLSARLGPYPYGNELRVATAPVQWLGMEHPGNIVLREDLPDLQQLYANVPLHALLHEIAHQWAGDRTTLADSLDFVWKEAIAEYLVYAFEQEQRPPAEALTTRDVWHSVGSGAPYPVRPEVAPDAPLSAWTSGGYGSGPMTLFVQLEPWLGQRALLNAIGHFLEADVRSMIDLRTALEGESGADLGRYFAAWVFGTETPEWPIFHVETTRTSTGNQLRVSQEHKSGLPFPCVVDLDLVGTTRSERVRADFGLAPTNSTLVIETTFAETITRVVIDPEKRLLDWSVSSPQLTATHLRWHP